MYYNGDSSIEISGTTTKVKVIKGWLCKFAPYEKNNLIRFELDTLTYADPFFALPNDILNAPIKTINILTKKEKDIVCRAGFMGMEQDEKTYEMKPVFGWYISDINNMASKKIFNAKDY